LRTFANPVTNALVAPISARRTSGTNGVARQDTVIAPIDNLWRPVSITV
jgi:hypothetical protein